MQVLTFEEANGIRAGYDTDLTQYDMAIKGGTLAIAEVIALLGVSVAFASMLVAFGGLLLNIYLALRPK